MMVRVLAVMRAAAVGSDHSDAVRMGVGMGPLGVVGTWTVAWTQTREILSGGVIKDAYRQIIST